MSLRSISHLPPIQDPRFDSSNLCEPVVTSEMIIRVGDCVEYMVACFIWKGMVKSIDKEKGIASIMDINFSYQIPYKFRDEKVPDNEGFLMLPAKSVPLQGILRSYPAALLTEFSSCFHKFYRCVYDLSYHTLFRIVNTPAAIRVGHIQRLMRTFTNPFFPLMVRTIQKEIRDMIIRRGKFKTMKNSVVVKGFHFEVFCALAGANVSRRKETFHALFSHPEEVKLSRYWFVIDCDRFVITVLGMVELRYSFKKPDQLVFKFEGFKLTSPSGQPIWDSLNGTSHVAPRSIFLVDTLNGVKLD